MQGPCQLAATTARRTSVLRGLVLWAEWVGESPSGGDYSPRLGLLGGSAVNGLAALLGDRIVGAGIA